MAEMTALKYLEEKSRMTERCSMACAKCLLANYNNGDEFSCILYEQKHPEQAIAIVQKWAQEHPRKTFLQDFLEKYPKAELRYNKFPEICPYSLGYAKNSQCVLDMEEQFCSEECEECWNRPLEEEENYG